MRPRAGTRFRREDAVALTPRQEEVLRLLERGYTNAEVAEALGISLDGAKFHVGEIISKLGVSTREDAVEAWRVRRRRLPAVTLLSLRWLGGGAAVVGVSVGAVLLALTALGDGDDPDAGAVGAHTVDTETSPPATPTEDRLAACPDPQPTPLAAAPGAIDWVDFVRFEGVSYLGMAPVGNASPAGRVPTSLLEQPYGRVARRLDGFVSDASHPSQDCDAAFLDAGTILYSVHGYDPRFRIATADGRLYESYRADGIKSAGEIIDLRDKVTAIEFRGPSAQQLQGRIHGPEEVSRLVNLFLSAEFDDSRQPPLADSEVSSVLLVFQLIDGTTFVRTYEPAIGRVWPGIWLPAEFNDAANAAMGR